MSKISKVCHGIVHMSRNFDVDGVNVDINRDTDVDVNVGANT